MRVERATGVGTGNTKMDAALLELELRYHQEAPHKSKPKDMRQSGRASS
jgi:hypothetical protein